MNEALVGVAALLVAGTAVAVASAPARADVKAGVDAWNSGDYKKAVDEWRPLAVSGDADAQFNLGQAYKLGRGVPVDFGMAEEWYRKAAVQGHLQAEDNYGLMLFENGKRDTAAPFLQKSAARGEPRAQYVLSTMYFNGDMVPRDWVRAYALMTRAVAAGLPKAPEKLAQMDSYISLRDRQRGTQLARQLEADATRLQNAPVVAGRDPAPGATTRPIHTTDVPPSRDTGLPATVTVIDAPGTRTARPAPLPRTPVAAAPKPATTPPRPAPAGAWRVQLGAFGEAGNAQRLWGQVSGRFPGRQPYYVKAGALTKLLVGPFASQAEAARACGAVKPCVPTR